MLKFVAFFAIAVAMAGCASPQEMASKECMGLGLTPQTPAFANCYEQSLARRQSAINAAIISN